MYEPALDPFKFLENVFSLTEGNAMLCRFFPCCVKELTDVGVIKIAAGTFHSLAQTVCSQVRINFIMFAG